jgi:hypothetical protein
MAAERALRRRALALVGGALAVVVALAIVGLTAAGSASATSALPSAATGVGGAADALPVPTQDPSTSNQKADEILSRSEFEEVQPGVYDRVIQWIGDAVSTLIEGLFTGGAGTAVAWVILAAAVVLVAMLALRVGRTLQTDPSRSVARVQVEVRRSPIEWSREAEAFEARGEWKAALRCRYRALVADLVSRKVVRDQPGHTTGEYRSDVTAALPGAAAEFGGASELFERAWYGDRPTGPDESSRFRELAEVVIGEAGGHRGELAEVGTSGPPGDEGAP